METETKILLCSQISNPLPHDIVTEILLRLPVKDILKFRCVSKAWLSLISSPEFKKAYQKSSACLARRLIFHSDTQLYTCQLCPKPGEEPVPFSFVSEYPDSDFQLVGSSNGLVCFVSSITDPIVVMNPATRSSREIYVSLKSGYDYFSSFGFGYDASSDDYKIIGFCVTEEITYSFRTYSLRNDTWTISNWSHSRIHPHSGVFLNGALHWKVHDRNDHWGVVAISLATNHSSSIAIPVPPNEYGIWSAWLGVLRGCLCVCFDRSTRMEVWVMKEYGVKESWSKVVCLPNYFCKRDIRWEPMCVFENGCVLVNIGSNMMSYTMFYYQNIFGLRHDFHVEDVIYSESFVSPYLDHHDREKT